MIALPRTPAGRIALAIGVSLLIHAIALFTPMIKLPPSETPLPPLVAKLEPLPQIGRPKPAKKPQPKPLLPQPAEPERLPAEPQAAEEKQPEPAAESAQPQAEPQPPAAAVEEYRPAHPLPRHAQLTFIASTPSGFEVAEARYRLDIGDDQRYTLTGGANTMGLVRLFNSRDMNQHSTGMLTAQGLRPDVYSVVRKTGGRTENLEAKFDWQAKVVSFSNGKETALTEQAQDDLSYLYQLSQLPLDQEVITISIVRGDRLTTYQLTVGTEEEIQTRLGKLRALPLRKVRAPGEEGLDIWLGLEYRLLPVKVRHYNRTGEIDGEMLISDIRVAEEN